MSYMYIGFPSHLLVSDKMMLKFSLACVRLVYDLLFQIEMKNLVSTRLRCFVLFVCVFGVRATCWCGFLSFCGCFVGMCLYAMDK